MREYTYVPHGSGIVYITIAVDGSWGGIDLLREGPRCPESPIVGTLPAPVKMRSKSTAPPKRLAKPSDFKHRLGMAKDGQPCTHNIKLI